MVLAPSLQMGAHEGAELSLSAERWNQQMSQIDIRYVLPADSRHCLTINQRKRQLNCQVLIYHALLCASIDERRN
jgi:hypothetical protein